VSDQFEIDLGALPGLVRGLGDRARDADGTIDDAKDLASRLSGLGGTAAGLTSHASDAARYIDRAKTGLFDLQKDLSVRGQRLADFEGYPDLAKAIAEAAKPPPKHHWYDPITDVADKAWDVVSSNPIGTLHTTLDVVGFIPVVGDVADGVNALIYIAEGDWANAAISGISIVPFVGSAAAGGRLASKGVKLAKGVARGASDVDHAADAVRTGRHAVDAARDGRHAVDAAHDAARGEMGDAARALATPARARAAALAAAAMALAADTVVPVHRRASRRNSRACVPRKRSGTAPAPSLAAAVCQTPEASCSTAATTTLPAYRGKLPINFAGRLSSTLTSSATRSGAPRQMIPRSPSTLTGGPWQGWPTATRRGLSRVSGSAHVDRMSCITCTTFSMAVVSTTWTTWSSRRPATT
jgi:hypothetical protein